MKYLMFLALPFVLFLICVLRGHYEQNRWPVYKMYKRPIVFLRNLLYASLCFVIDGGLLTVKANNPLNENLIGVLVGIIAILGLYFVSVFTGAVIIRKSIFYSIY